MIRLANPQFPPSTLSAIERVLASGNLTQGPVVAEFETAIARLCGARHGIATTSATTAIELTLAALDIGPDDEVIAADFTYPATGNAVLRRGARLVLCDVEPDTYCLSASALLERLTPRTTAVIAVDVFGLPADYSALWPMLQERGIKLVADAACSLGGAIGGRSTGTFGTASCFSFHPRKSLTTGEGGMVLADDQELADRMRRLRNHGTERVGWRSSFVEPGYNFRLSDMNAAVGLAQVAGFPEVVSRRRELASRLSRSLESIADVTPQSIPSGHQHPFQAFVVRCDPGLDRDRLIAELRDLGVEATLGTYAMHAEPAFSRLCGTAPGDLPVSFALAAETLALPLHQGMSPDDVDRVVAALEKAIKAQRRS